MRSHTLFHRALALAAFILMAATPAWSGQLEAVGIRSGISTTRLTGAFGDAIGNDYRNGFTAAAYWRFRLGRLLSFAPEIAWVPRGGDGSIQWITSGPPATAYEVAVENRIDYLEFPLLVRADLPVAPVRPYLIAGPAPAVKTGVKQVVTMSSRTLPGASSPQLQHANIFESVGTLGSQRIEAIDLGLVGGAGATLGTGRARLVIEGRYTYGLLDVIEGGGESRNGGFAFALGVELH